MQEKQEQPYKPEVPTPDVLRDRAATVLAANIEDLLQNHPEAKNGVLVVDTDAVLDNRRPVVGADAETDERGATPCRVAVIDNGAGSYAFQLRATDGKIGRPEGAGSDFGDPSDADSQDGGKYDYVAVGANPGSRHGALQMYGVIEGVDGDLDTYVPFETSTPHSNPAEYTFANQFIADILRDLPTGEQLSA